MPVTPMMQQYLNIKEQYPGTILFYRLGDFYEMFFDDAKLVSRELELTLTGKDCGLSERAPMCGVPYHAVDTYLQKLIEKGYKEATCEQMTDPATTKGLVEREVIRVVTPGTVIETNMLEDRKANYIASLCLKKNLAGCAFCDVSTGEFYLYQIPDARASLSDELARLDPSEIIVNDRDAFSQFEPERAAKAEALDAESYSFAVAAKVMKAHFGKTPADMGFDGQRLAVSAAGALLSYLTQTQKNALSHILTAKSYEAERYMALDRAALRNLELVETARGKTRRGSLLWILDKTRTAMGSRLMRSWIERPLKEPQQIERRLDAVQQLLEDPMTSDSLRQAFDSVYDVERLLSRIAYDTVNARDCLSLVATLETIPLIKDYDNLLVVQTFSKSRSMAGARLGFAAGSKALIADLNAIKYSINPYNVNSMTLAVGLGVLLDEETTKANCRTIMDNRAYTTAALEKLGFEVLPSSSNFIFARSEHIGGRDLYLKLKERGVLIRHFAQPGIEEWSRITIGTKGQMDIFLKNVREILEEQK